MKTINTLLYLSILVCTAFFINACSSKNISSEASLLQFEISKQAILNQRFVVEFDEDVNPKQDFLLIDNYPSAQTGRVYYMQNGSGYDAIMNNIKIASTKKGNIVCTFELLDPPLPKQDVRIELVRNSNKAYANIYNKSLIGQIVTIDEFGFDIKAEREKIKNRYNKDNIKR